MMREAGRERDGDALLALRRDISHMTNKSHGLDHLLHKYLSAPMKEAGGINNYG